MSKTNTHRGRTLTEFHQKCHFAHWRSYDKITGSALPLHCCKAHARINSKMRNSTPCKIVTPDNFTSNVCTRDYVGDGNYCANFGKNRFSGVFSPNKWNITPLRLFCLSCPVSCPVLSFFDPAPRSNRWTYFRPLWLKRRLSAQCLLGVTAIDNVIWGICFQNPLKVSVKRQLQAKMWKSLYLENCNSDQAEIWGKTETKTCTSWVGYHYLNQIQHGWRSPCWKSLWRHNSTAYDPISMKFGAPMQTRCRWLRKS